MSARVGCFVLAVAKQKGGVPRTTTAAALGAACSDLGKRVLLVDLDPQASLTFSLGHDPGTITTSVHQVLLGTASAEDAVLPTGPTTKGSAAYREVAGRLLETIG